MKLLLDISSAHTVSPGIGVLQILFMMLESQEESQSYKKLMHSRIKVHFCPIYCI